MPTRAQTFLHLDAHLYEDIAIEEMDGCGVIVWVLGVLVLTKAGGFMGGVVPKRAVSARRIARKLRSCDACGFRFTTEMAADGLQQLVAEGLIEDDGDDWKIPAWDQWQTDPAMSGAERMKKLRARRKVERDASDKRDDRASRCDESDASDESDGHCTAKHSNTLQGNAPEDQEPPPSAGQTVIPAKSKTITFNRLQSTEDAELLDGDSIKASCLRIFFHWCQKTGQGKTTQFTPNRAGAIRRALKHSSEAELIAAVDGLAAHRFHVEGGYLELVKYAIKDRETVEKWVEAPKAMEPKRQKQAHVPYSNNNPDDDEAAREWARRKGVL